MNEFDIQHVVSNWKKAQVHMKIAPNATHREVLPFYSVRRGTVSFRKCNTRLTFIMQAKVGSESIHANLLKWNASSVQCPDEYRSHTCGFMFVRNPIDRFVSGFVEMEWRFRQGRALYGTTDMDDVWTFHKYPLGTRERSIHFLQDLLEFKWHSVPKALEHRDAFKHVYSMHGQAAHGFKMFGSDMLVGKLENFDSEWKRITSLCPGALIPFDVSMYTHETSRDPMRVKSAMVELTHELHVRRALCHVFAPDFKSFGYSC